MEKPPQFYSPEEIRAHSQQWKEAAQIIGDTEHTRTEPESSESLPSRYDIAELHGESFIHDVIPRLIMEKHGQGKVKILDVGGGLALYTDQIRSTFGDQVEVYSTGLNKRVGNSIRRGELQRGKMHHNDLKWSSIFQLSKYPEFDLILDTYGEQFYHTEQAVADFHVKLNTHDQLRKLYRYLEAVVVKLNDGGHASIVSIETESPDVIDHIPYFIIDMEKISLPIKYAMGLL
jgi:hypothetical protein